MSQPETIDFEKELAIKQISDVLRCLDIYYVLALLGRLKLRKESETPLVTG